MDRSSKTWIVWMLERRRKKYVLGIEGEQVQERDKKKALKEKRDAYSTFFFNCTRARTKVGWGG